MSMTLFPLRPEADSQNLPAIRPLGDVGPGTNAPAETQQLTDFLAVVARHWRLVTSVAAGGCLCGVLVTWLQTPLYRTKTSIEIQNINGDFLNMKQVRAVPDNSQGTDALMDVQTQIEILQSTMLARSTTQTMKKMGPQPAYRPRPPVWRTLLRVGEESGVSAPPLSDATFKLLAESVKAHEVRQTRMIEIRVEAPSPILAADFANTLVAEYVHQNAKARSQMTGAAEDATRSQLTEMRQKLEASEDAMQSYATQHGLVFTSERQNISDDRLRQVQGDLLRAQADLAEKEARRQLASSSKADSLPDVVRDADLRGLRAKLIDLRRQEAELLTIFKPDYSEVRKVRAQAEELQSAIDRERDRIVNRILNEYTEASEKHKLLTITYDDAVRRAASESQAAVRYDILKHEVEANLSAYQGAQARVKELSLAAAIGASNVRVIDPAEPPEHPNSPKLPLNIALGMFSGLTLGIGFVFVQDSTNQNLRHPGEAMMRLGVRELGVIPSVGENIAKVKSLRIYKSAAALEDRLSGIGDTDNQGHAPTTDDFRTLLTSIMFSGDDGNQPKLVVITSSSPQEGKTTVASNLAIAFARAGKRVLLIDGDLRKPQVHQLFGLPNAVGLSNLLQGNSSVGEAQRPILSTSIPRLSVLTSGSLTETPGDLLFEPHLRVLLASYRERFEMVVVDSPPMMRMPDARLLGRNSDGVILVARANKTTRTSIHLASQRLALDNSRLLGVVLNDWNGEDSQYPSYS